MARQGGRGRGRGKEGGLKREREGTGRGAAVGRLHARNAGEGAPLVVHHPPEQGAGKKGKGNGKISQARGDRDPTYDEGESALLTVHHPSMQGAGKRGRECGIGLPDK